MTCVAVHAQLTRPNKIMASADYRPPRGQTAPSCGVWGEDSCNLGIPQLGAVKSGAAQRPADKAKSAKCGYSAQGSVTTQ